MRHIISILVCLFLLNGTAWSQTDWQEAFQAWITGEDMEDSYGEEAMELLQELSETRINLNQTSREELEQLPFLTAQQVEGIVEYLDRYKPMRSLAELQMISDLDFNTRKLLEYFVYTGEEKARSTWPKWHDITKYGKHQIAASTKIPFYDRKGDKNGYLGYKYRHDLRYQFAYHNRIKFGITGAQDAGEPFFANCNKYGYDHYSYYFQLRNMGWIEELNLGKYRVQLGMGLVMNTGIHLGKLADLQSMGRSTHVLTAHASRSQSGYLQGAAATVRLSQRWKVTAFASYQALDATLNDDGTARTLITNGYHRTPTEIDKKNNTHETDLGASIQWRKGSLYLNANGVYTHFDRTLKPDKLNAVYRRYAPEGDYFFNASLDYGYTSHRLSLSGETACNGDGALAAIHSLTVKVTETLSLMAIHRYYDKRYTALHARSLSENSSVQNEHGLYLGATWNPTRSWNIQGYADYAHFGWPRYLISASSDALDVMLCTRYNRQTWSFDGRYRIHIRQRDNADKTLLTNRTDHRMRLGVTNQLTSRLSLRTEADAVLTQTDKGKSSGVLVSEHATWQWRWLRIDAHTGWFHTDDYDSRLYQYERSLQYDYSYPLYYGHGIRYSLLASGQLGSHLTLTAKIGVTNYFDRATISSGLQEIDRSSMTDLLLQVRWIL